MDDNIVRYVLVDDGFGNRSWYIDETDSVEERDFVLVPYEMCIRDSNNSLKEAALVSVVPAITFISFPCEL